MVLQSANVCPGCHHHLKFNAGAEPDAKNLSAMRIEGTIHHPVPNEPCEYCVVISITNERGEKITRQVVGVGALQAGERHKYTFSVDLIPSRGAGGVRRT